jgi:hypothetical protein
MRALNRGCQAVILGALILVLTACRGSSREAPPPATEAPPTSTPRVTATTVRPTTTAAGTPGSTPGATVTGTAGAAATGTPGLITGSPAAGAAASSGPLSQQQLDQMALSATDLPPGFAVTASGPGGPELGPDVLASYQEEFQQRDVTSIQALQQTIVIINLLGQYRDSASALAAIRAISVQSLNQILGGVNLSAEAATVPAIAEDSQGFHFTGDTNGISVGGYLIVYHRGPIASLVLTAAVKGSEALPQTIDLAQKQAQKIPAAR